METILKSINAVMGVTGCFVCDGDGQLVASALPELFDRETLSGVGKTITQTMAGLSTSRKKKVGEIDLLYGESRFIAMSAGVNCLCILCVRNVNLPLLNLTAKMAVKKLAGLAGERVGVAASGFVVPAAASPRDQILRNETRLILNAAHDQAVVIKATGDAAIRLCCPSAPRLAPNLEQMILELAGLQKQSVQIKHLFENLGYAAEERFNLLQGSQRLRFVHAGHELGVEVYLNALVMYHQLNFGERITMNQDTLTLADLLLWKLQVVDAAEGILRTIYTLLYDHELGGPGETEKIDTVRIMDMCTSDWGWYKTVTSNLEKCLTWSQAEFGDQAGVVAERGRRLLQIMNDAPKSVGWQLRSRIGERQRWYETPE
jgi:predicted regulator of Ras-like GTPase activity (Roadblock/LC7/MglB family)